MSFDSVNAPFGGAPAPFGYDPTPRPRYLGYAGFVTTPACWDDVIQQFLAVAPPGCVGAMGRVLHVPSYGYELSERAKNFDLLDEAAEALALSDCTVIGQVGTNWVHCNGTTPDDIAAYCDRLSEKVGATFVMAGHSIVEALRSIGAERITVSNGYYRDDWRDGINGYLTAAGFEVVASGHMRDQGIHPSLEAQMEVEAVTHWDHSDRECVQTILAAHEAAPDADVVVQTGQGMKIVPHIPTLEAIVGKPVIASDNSLFWNMLRHLDLGLPVRGHGSLLAGL